MVSKNQKKLINSLRQKKYRKQHGLFVAEGKKLVGELLVADFELHAIFATHPEDFDTPTEKTHRVTEEELKTISFLTTSQSVLAVFCIPVSKKETIDGLTVVLDDVRDPGNLGTIIRLCDWFGVANLVCSEQTVDCYNPKVVQATMGSITRVSVQYVCLLDFLQQQKGKVSIFGTSMDGDTVYEQQLPVQGVLVMGNEANGVSPAIAALVDQQLTIPRFGVLQATESLNVATATSILLSEFRRGE